MSTLSPDISASIPNSNVGSNNSWVEIDNAGRTLYAQAVFPIGGAVPGLDIPPHDYVEMIYTGSDVTTINYRVGGLTGTIVATLTMTYDSGNLIGVAKS